MSIGRELEIDELTRAGTEACKLVVPDIAYKLQAHLAEQERIKLMAEEERVRFMRHVGSLIGETVLLGGIASKYYDLTRGRVRFYYDYTNRPQDVIVPFDEYEIVDVGNDGIQVYNDGKLREMEMQPHVKFDSVFFESPESTE